MAAPRGKLVNRAELADLFGKSLPTIDAWVRRGCPFVQRGSKGREWQFNTAEVADWRESEAAGGDPSEIDLAVERALLAREQREGHALKNAIARGEVVSVEEIGRLLDRENAVVRDRLLTMPGKLGSDLTPKQVARVEAEVRDALTELHDATDIIAEITAIAAQDPEEQEAVSATAEP